MESRLTLDYDAETDILYLSRCEPYAEQESQDIGDEIVARLNPNTGVIENLEILFFTRRLRDGSPRTLPVSADFHLPADI